MDSSSIPKAERLALLESARHSSVRILARQTSRTSQALFEHAGARIGKTEWTVAEWRVLLQSLDDSPLTVGEWLSQPLDLGPCLPSAA